VSSIDLIRNPCGFGEYFGVIHTLARKPPLFVEGERINY
jgi:hypothetical protein